MNHRIYRISILAVMLCFWSVIARGGEYHSGVTSTEILKTTTTSIGQPIAYPANGTPQVTASVVEIPSGGETGWHSHTTPLYAWMVAGSLTVEYEGGRKITFHDGEPIIEALNTSHNGRNNGSTPARLLVFNLGTRNVPPK